MKSLVNGRFVLAVLTVACLMTVLLTVIPIRSGSPSAGEYDAWLDWNDDGKIDMNDIGHVARSFGTSGQNISKASPVYDSGWLDLRNETGEYYTLAHNLNLTSLDMIVDARQRTQIWDRTYGGAGIDVAEALVQTGDGGYALAGYTNSSGAGYNDAWLVKTDSAGNMMWNQTYGGISDDYAFALVQTNDGGYALAGRTASLGAGHYDFWLVKTDAAGNAQWSRTYGGTVWDDAHALVQTTDGGYALAGTTQSFGAGYTDFWLVKTDELGNMQWNQTYGGTETDVAEALVQTGDGGYALAGNTMSFGAGYADSWLVKTDSSGNMQWNRTYGGAGIDVAEALVQTGDGGYALAGGTIFSFGSNSVDAYLVKTDASGNLVWNKIYGGTDSEYAYALLQTGDGGYALAGYSDDYAGNYSAYLVKTDASGTMQWNKTYGGTNDNYAYGLVQTGDGGYALAGIAGGRAWLVKSESESGLAWIPSFMNSITLVRDEATLWNFVRVQIWKKR
jgi:hypothetical protein